MLPNEPADVSNAENTPALPEPVEQSDAATRVHIGLDAASLEAVQELVRRLKSGERVVIENGTIMVEDVSHIAGIVIGDNATVHVGTSDDLGTRAVPIGEGEPRPGPRIPGPPIGESRPRSGPRIPGPPIE